MDIRKKINEIIPKNDYHHRHEFSNHRLIDNLTYEEKKLIEDELIKMLFSNPHDILIAQTLSYMKSVKALNALKYSLKLNTNQLQKIIIASSIFKINQDKSMIEIAINAFNHLHDNMDIILSFPSLKEFESDIVNIVIEKYLNDSDFLVSYNAKRALGIIKD